MDGDVGKTMGRISISNCWSDANHDNKSIVKVMMIMIIMLVLMMTIMKL